MVRGQECGLAMENFMQIQLGLSSETSGMTGQILPLTLNFSSGEKAINNDGNEGGEKGERNGRIKGRNERTANGEKTRTTGIRRMRKERSKKLTQKGQKKK